MKKRWMAGVLSICVLLSLSACGNSKKEEKNTENSEITITSLDGNAEEVEVTLPYDPKRVAILDMASFDILVSLGLEERVVGSASTTIPYLAEHLEGVENIGTIKQADMEAVMQCDPDVIFIGGRLAEVYDELSAIAPVVYLSIDEETGVVDSVKKNAATIASIFGKEAEVEEKVADFEARIQKLNQVSDGKKAIIGMCTSGSFNVLGKDGRCSMIGREIGFENISVGAEEFTSTHGNEASFEYIVKQNPDYIFVLDRDAAIATEGAKLAKEVMENELVKSTDAYKNGNIIYLENPTIWYTAEGGIEALNIMLQDLEKELL